MSQGDAGGPHLISLLRNERTGSYVWDTALPTAADGLSFHAEHSLIRTSVRRTTQLESSRAVGSSSARSFYPS